MAADLVYSIDENVVWQWRNEAISNHTADLAAYHRATAVERKPGEQTRPLFLTTSTGAKIEARVEIIFHPLGRWHLGRRRFDVCFPDIALDPSLRPPSKGEIYTAIFGCFDPEETNWIRESKITIGYPNPISLPFDSELRPVSMPITAGGTIRAGDPVFIDASRALAIYASGAEVAIYASGAEMTEHGFIHDPSPQ